MRWRLTIAGKSVELDWTLILGPVLLSGLRFAPLEWLAVLALLVLHTLGHLAGAKLVGGLVTTVRLTGYGGACEWVGHRSPLERASVAWGGLLTQAAILFAATLAPSSWPAPLLRVATEGNAWLFAANLLPLRPLDGVEAWRLPWLLGRRLSAVARGQRGAIYETEATREVDPEDPHHAQAKELAARLIEQARRDDAS